MKERKGNVSKKWIVLLCVMVCAFLPAHTDAAPKVRLNKTKVTVKHTHKFKECRKVSPTCTEEGYVLYQCASCEATEKRDVKEALGHKAECEEIKEYPTDEANGVAESVCGRCGEVLEQKEITLQDLYTYVFRNGGVVITEFSGEYGGEIDIPDIIEGKNVIGIGSSAFEDCSGLSSVNIPESVTSIGYCAFGDCSRLSSVSIPGSVTGIGNYAFSGCSNLSSVSIAEGVTRIGDSAFYNCSGLSSINIPVV